MNDTVTLIADTPSDLDREINRLCHPSSATVGTMPLMRGYNADTHAKLCQFRLLGLNAKSAAHACGLEEKTLRGWLEDYPILRMHLDQIAALAIAHASKLLREKMAEAGPVGLNAVKFFLTTHADEFKTDTKLTIEHSTGEHTEQILSIYGLKKPAVPDTCPEVPQDKKCRVPTASPTSLPAPQATPDISKLDL